MIPLEVIVKMHGFAVKYRKRRYIKYWNNQTINESDYIRLK